MVTMSFNLLIKNKKKREKN